MMQNWGLGGLGGGGGGGGFQGGARQKFEEQYHCYSVAFAEKPHLEVRERIAATCTLVDTMKQRL
jgi:hypothetical protein